MTNIAHITGCHQAAKVMKAEANMRQIRPMLMLTNMLPMIVKSVFVLNAYAVIPQVIAAVIPPAASTFSLG